MEPWEVYEFTSDGLIVVTAIPAIVLAFCSLCLVRHRTDPVRFSFTLLNITFCLFAVFCVLQCTALMLSTAYHQVFNYPNNNSFQGVQTLSAQAYLSALANLSDSLTEIFLFVTLAVLSTDILTVYAIGKPPGSGRLFGSSTGFDIERVFRLGCYVIAGVLCVLAVTETGIIMGLDASIIANGEAYSTFFYYSHGGLHDQYLHLNVAIVTMFLILAIYMICRSVMIKIKCRREKRVKTASTYLVVCHSLWLLRTTYNIIYTQLFLGDRTGQKDYNWNPFTTVTNLAFSTWPAFIILTILFSLGVKRRKGLWSKDYHDSTTVIKVSPPSTDHDIEMSPIEANPPGQSEPQPTEQTSTTATPVEASPAEPPPSARQSVEQSSQPPTTTTTLSPTRSNDQPPFPMAHPSTQGLTPQQTPWGFGYFVPQDPNQPIQQVSQGPSQRRPVPPTWPSQGSPGVQSDFDYTMQPPPEYEQHVHHSRPPPGGQPPHIVLAEDDVEALGLDHQADGRPPDVEDPSQYPPKK